MVVSRARLLMAANAVDESGCGSQTIFRDTSRTIGERLIGQGQMEKARKERLVQQSVNSHSNEYDNGGGIIVYASLSCRLLLAFTMAATDASTAILLYSVSGEGA